MPTTKAEVDSDVGRIRAYFEYKLGHFERAAEELENILRRDPGLAGVWFDLGVVHAAAAHRERACRAFVRAGHGDSFYNAGVLAQAGGRPKRAKVFFRRAVQTYPLWAIHRRVSAWLASLGLPPSNLRTAKAWPASYLSTPELQTSLAQAFVGAGALQEAADAYRRALAARPSAGLHCDLGNVLRRMTQNDDARRHLGIALKMQPGMYRALTELASVADAEKKYAEAVELYEKVVAQAPDNAFAHSRLILFNAMEGKLGAADESHANMVRALRNSDIAGYHWEQLAPIAYRAIIRPLPAPLYDAVTRAIAKQLDERVGPKPATAAAQRRNTSSSAQLRIGYVSSHFRDHPIGHVVADLFKCHDRDRFEVHAFMFATADTSNYVRSVREGVDHYHVMEGKAADIAAQIRDAELDILVYLDGYMHHVLLRTLAHRPAPIQVFWLGHAGSLDLPSIDYLIADSHVVPTDEENRYRPKVVRLPDTYHCAPRPEIAATPTRKQSGLPENGFVFCAFNNLEKINLEIFQSWMRILAAVESSVLWLSVPNGGGAAHNLRAAAKAQRVAEDRLIFAERLPDKAEHLARHKIAGLFLDTSTLNASTTALDALWAGLPLLTIKGDRFSNRIAASFLKAVGLDDMVCASLSAYETRAIQLAKDTDALQTIRARLSANRDTYPLFRPEKFCAHLEAAFVAMAERHRTGKRPQAFAVAQDAAIPPS